MSYSTVTDIGSKNPIISSKNLSTNGFLNFVGQAEERETNFTLHPQAYDRLVQDDRVLTALSNKPNVSISKY